MSGSVVPVRRGARRAAPALPDGEFALPAPPVHAPAGGTRWGQLAMAVPMLAGTVATALLFAGKDGGAYSYVVGGVFGVSSLAMMAGGFGVGGRQRRSDAAVARGEYLRQLDEFRDRVRAGARAQRAALAYRHPAPDALWSFVDSHRVWERRPADGDFAVVRIGVGPQELATPLVPPPAGTGEAYDPPAALALRRFLDTYALVPDLPVALSMPAFRRVYVCGEAARGLVRAAIAQLVTFHGPDDVAIAVCAADGTAWDYLKWLPHHHDRKAADAVGPRRLVHSRLAALTGDPSRFTVVVLDGGDPAGARPGDRMCVLDLDGPAPDPLPPASLRLDVEAGGRLTTYGSQAPPLAAPGDLSVWSAPPGRPLPRQLGGLRAEAPRGDEEIGTADDLAPAAAEALARTLAPLRLDGQLTPVAGPDIAATLSDLLGPDLIRADPLGATDPIDVARAWAPRAPHDFLRVPIGLDTAGQPVVLDLKESARDGMGPHGLLIGATGSGKSELLRTLVLGLAATHDPADLNVVLVDFKGGATFASLDRLPHTAAVITNLADRLTLVDRMEDALNGEMVRRQTILRDAGNLASRYDYERARAARPDLAPMPVLLVVCDEFSELLSAKPEFVDLFVAIGRLGRSLGVHLLLASQRLEEGRLRGLDTHLSYRIGLRTFSAIESRAVLGVPDAYELPRAPGHAYLKAGTEPLVRFRAAYVSGPYAPAGPGDDRSPGWRVLPFTAAPVDAGDPDTAIPAERAAPTVLDVVAGALAGRGTPAHQVWLPPLEMSAPLDGLLGPLFTDPDRGLTTVMRHGPLRVPVAVVDRPYEQRHEPLWVDLSGAAGHVAIVGAPRAGKSTLLATLLVGLALTHAPGEVSAYVLDFGGGTAGGIVADLPHVGTVVGRHAPDAVRRTVGEIASLLAARERSGDADPYGDVLLVIDGWSTLRADFDDLETVVTDIAARGLAWRIHVVVTAVRWSELRPALRDLLGTRLELRLGDVADSAVNRKAAGDVPENTPGRGITAEGRHFLAAAPALDGGRPDKLVEAIRTAWPGAPVPAIRELPPLIHWDPVLADSAAGRLVLPIGVAEADLRPVSLDFAADPHLVVLGDAGCGKSSFLRALASSIIRRYAPEQARVVIVDYRRSLLGDVEGEHLIGYATAAAPAAELLGSVAAYMRARLPGPDVTPAQLRARSWWTGPECFVLVDDFDLVGGGPLEPLVEFLPQARDVGLHVVVTRRAGGAARAMFEPTLAKLRELATPGLLMSGPPEEGTLFGSVKARLLPPGRAVLSCRSAGASLIQLFYAPPAPL